MCIEEDLNNRGGTGRSMSTSVDAMQDVEPLGLHVIVIDSKVEHQRRTPWSGWGGFLLPVGDPEEFSQTFSTVAGQFYGGDFDPTIPCQEAEATEKGDIKIKSLQVANRETPDADADRIPSQEAIVEDRGNPQKNATANRIVHEDSDVSESCAPAHTNTAEERDLVPSDAAPASLSSRSVRTLHYDNDSLQSAAFFTSVIWLIGRILRLGFAGPAFLIRLTAPRFPLLGYAFFAPSGVSNEPALQEPPEEEAEPQHTEEAAKLASSQETDAGDEASSQADAAVAVENVAAGETVLPQQPEAAIRGKEAAFPPLQTCAPDVDTVAASVLAGFVNPPRSPGSSSDNTEGKATPDSPMQNWVDSAHTFHRMLMKAIAPDQDRTAPSEKQRQRQAARLGKAEPSSLEETRWALELLQSRPDNKWVVEEDAGGAGSAAASAAGGSTGGGWFYSSAFPSPSLVALGAAEDAADIREEEHSYAMVRWRRWLRKRVIAVPPRVVEELRWTGGHPGTVGEVIGGVSEGWLAVMNLSIHRIVGCVYLPQGENVWSVRRGEVKGLGLGASWMLNVRELQGTGALIALARQEESLPAALTAAMAKTLCVVKPEAVFKRLFATIAAPDSAMASLVTAAGADSVVAMDSLQRDILLPSSHPDIQRLQYQAEHPEQRWREEARVSEAGGLCEEEAQLLAVRKLKVRAALEGLLGEPVALEHVPTIALCLSGGGVRAMIATLGALLAAEEMGVLDCCSYTSALSGGAWLQGCWMEAAGSNRDVLERLAAFLPEACSQHPLFTAGRSIASDPSSRPLGRRGSSGSWSAGSAGSDGEGGGSELFRWDSFSFRDGGVSFGEGGRSEGEAREAREGGTRGPGSDGRGSPPMADPWSWSALWQAGQSRVKAKDSLASTLAEWYKWTSAPSLVELYGFTIANAWLLPRPDDDAPRLGRGLSAQRSTLAAGSRPLPIYTAVRIEDDAKEGAGGGNAAAAAAAAVGAEGDEYEWVEFTPMTFASCRTERSVPVWALGRNFHQGRSVSSGPELPLPILFGMWGAAFTASPREVLRALRTKRKNEQRPEHVAAAIAEHVLALAEHAVALGAQESSARLRRMRIVDPFQCPSPFAGLEAPLSRAGSARPCGAGEERAGEAVRGSKRGEEKLVLTDAGINFNLPVPPLLRPERGVDVMVMVDSRAFCSEESVDESRELTCAAQYARENGFAFPNLPPHKLKGMGARPCTVFGGDDDEGEEQPTRRASLDAGARDGVSEKEGELPTSGSAPPCAAAAEEMEGSKQAPMVVYLPLVKNEAVDRELDPVNDDWASFYEFQYEPARFKRLLRLARENVLTSKHLLLDAIRRAVQLKREETARAASAGARRRS